MIKLLLIIINNSSFSSSIYYYYFNNIIMLCIIYTVCSSMCFGGVPNQPGSRTYPRRGWPCSASTSNRSTHGVLKTNGEDDLKAPRSATKVREGTRSPCLEGLVQDDMFTLRAGQGTPTHAKVSLLLQEDRPPKSSLLLNG